MKMDLFHGGTMDLRFCLGNKGENRYGVIDYLLWQTAFVYYAAYFAKAPVMAHGATAASAPMTAVASIVMAMIMIISFRGVNVAACFIVYDIELGADQPALLHLARPYAEPSQAKGADMTADGFDVRSGVEQGADEHVAADSGGCIEIKNPFH
jgi:hypothetical protein